MCQMKMKTEIDIGESMTYTRFSKLDISCNELSDILDTLVECLLTADIDKLETNLELDVGELSTTIESLYNRLNTECKMRKSIPSYLRVRKDRIYPYEY